MDIEAIRTYCLAQPLATEDSAFGEETVLFRIYDRIFAFLDLTRPDVVVLKCNPDKAIDLRDRYEGIRGAWHWNKRYWNEIHFDTDVPDELIYDLIDHSLHEVLHKLPQKIQKEYDAYLTSSAGELVCSSL